MKFSNLSKKYRDNKIDQTSTISKTTLKDFGVKY